MGRSADGVLTKVRVLEFLYHNPNDHPAVFVLTAGDATLKLTADHRVMTDRGWRRAEDITVGITIYQYDGNSQRLVASRVEQVEREHYAGQLLTIRTSADNYIANGILIHTE